MTLPLTGDEMTDAARRNADYMFRRYVHTMRIAFEDDAERLMLQAIEEVRVGRIGEARAAIEKNRMTPPAPAKTSAVERKTPSIFD